MQTPLPLDIRSIPDRPFDYVETPEQRKWLEDKIKEFESEGATVFFVLARTYDRSAE